MWSKGIVTEACQEVIKFMKESAVPYLTAPHDVHNPKSGEVMKRLGMVYRYSYEEQWQPKDIPVTFRMYQLNLDGQYDRIFLPYWKRHPVHFVEDIVG